MLFEGFRDAPNFPFLSFYPFGCSIFLVSPFLFLIFREGGRYKALAWIAIALLTFALWAHGNPGGWQFSYRYATELLPWMFLLLLGNGPAKISCDRAVTFRCFGNDQRARHLSISLDESNPPLSGRTKILQ